MFPEKKTLTIFFLTCDRIIRAELLKVWFTRKPPQNYLPYYNYDLLSSKVDAQNQSL